MGGTYINGVEGEVRFEDRLDLYDTLQWGLSVGCFMRWQKMDGSVLERETTTMESEMLKCLQARVEDD